MMDHFERLGLPRRFSVDKGTLEREYLARSRLVHPDLHAVVNAEATEQSALLNTAYQTLTDPFKRAEYYLSLLGGPTARDEKGQDQSFLFEMMELREQLESLAGDEAAMARAEEELTERRNAVIDVVAKQFAKIEAAGTATSSDLLAIRKELNAAKTLASLIRGLTDPGID
jgi:molecular chaperone HscB